MIDDAFFIYFILLMITCVTYVLFGQITVRRLRKNPKTKDALGLSLVSGWDIVNVAMALSLPNKLMYKIENSRWGIAEASLTKIEPFTNAFDKFLAILFFFSLVSSFLIIITLVIISE